jgi:hypothetical protein
MAADVAAALRRELLRLARAEEELAAQEAVNVPYWEPCPVSVLGHRAAADALRAKAEAITSAA